MPPTGCGAKAIFIGSISSGFSAIRRGRGCWNRRRCCGRSCFWHGRRSILRTATPPWIAWSLSGTAWAVWWRGSRSRMLMIFSGGTRPDGPWKRSAQRPRCGNTCGRRFSSTLRRWSVASYSSARRIAVRAWLTGWLAASPPISSAFPHPRRHNTGSSWTTTAIFSPTTSGVPGRRASIAWSRPTRCSTPWRRCRSVPVYGCIRSSAPAAWPSLAGRATASCRFPAQCWPALAASCSFPYATKNCTATILR